MTAENEVIYAIKNRRSIRFFKEKEVPDEIIKELIDCGIHAPSALALYPWRFAVVKDKKLMKKISDYVRPVIIDSLKNAKTGGMTKKYLEMAGEKNFSIFYNASCLLLVLGRDDAIRADIDCSLCAQNIMLAAHSIGLGTCWIGSAGHLEKSRDLMSKLKIPEGYHLVASIILGYPDEKREMPKREKPEIVWIK
ncbi:nitroreductase [Methanomicrobium sp. W14]|uniref:nitroreductase family protein n=1 Tax=Methanomicrobium sp. W14 TaxID=2817839 RepID=UPI001AE55256|nr:nitroreductase family protein [Methanomicrobium sp. W14]MBP2132702.1 nitroreductase [Methanomicrobium sp. W14]